MAKQLQTAIKHFRLEPPRRKPQVQDTKALEDEMGSVLSKGTFEPDELGILKQVYDEVTSQSWFDQSPEAKEAFAKYLIETFPSGTFDMRKHRAVVEASAQMFYSLDNAS